MQPKFAPVNNLDTIWWWGMGSRQATERKKDPLYPIWRAGYGQKWLKSGGKWGKIVKKRGFPRNRYPERWENSIDIM